MGGPRMSTTSTKRGRKHKNIRWTISHTKCIYLSPDLEQLIPPPISVSASPGPPSTLEQDQRNAVATTAAYRVKGY